MVIENKVYVGYLYIWERMGRPYVVNTKGSMKTVANDNGLEWREV